MIRRPPRSTRTDTLFPYTTLFRSHCQHQRLVRLLQCGAGRRFRGGPFRCEYPQLSPVGKVRTAGPSGLVVRPPREKDPALGRPTPCRKWQEKPSYSNSDELRVGKERVSTCSSRWPPYHSKPKKTKYT